MVSSLQIDDVVAGSVKRRCLQAVDGYLFWLEQRPQEAGRGVIVRFDPKTTSSVDLTPASYSVRSKVHEYGGGDFLATRSGLFFVNAADQQIYRQQGDQITVLTKVSDIDTRYADFAFDCQQGFLYCVREQHRDVVLNDLVRISLAGEVHVMASGADFYAAPRLAPNGQTLCWLQWQLPHMPWDNCALQEINLKTGAVTTIVADDNIAVLSPQYDGNNQLWFVDDRDGYWRVRSRHSPSLPRSPAGHDCGIAAWSLGQQLFCVDTAQNVIAIVFDRGKQTLAVNDEISAPQFAECGAQIVAHDDAVYFFASTETCAETLHCFSPATMDSHRVLPTLSYDAVVANSLDVDGVQAYFYSASATNATALIVFCHSGPTGLASSALNLMYQFYLQHGFAILDINYRGSYGFGRVYRQALNRHWGELDVQDCAKVVAHVLATQNIDRRRVYLRGNSAGGLTALFLLAQPDTPFSAAALRYPVVDLARLQAISHKFEVGYLGELIGAVNNADSRWSLRSPSSLQSQIVTPLLLAQGENDPVVPMTQAQSLCDALQDKGTPCQLLVLAGEGHGFRRGESLSRCLQAEFDWFVRWS